MKTTLRISALLAGLAALASCNKGNIDGPDKGPERDAICISFVSDTKSSSTAETEINSGFAGCYYKDSGKYFAEGEYDPEEKGIMIYDIPEKAIDIYFICNPKVEKMNWPQSVNDLKNITIPASVTEGHLGRRNVNGEALIWAPGQNKHIKTDYDPLYETVNVIRKNSNDEKIHSFTIKSAKAVNCPTTINPFGTSSTGKENGDYCSTSDIESLVIGGGESSSILYVPWNIGSTQIEIKVERYMNNGFSYEETYTNTIVKNIDKYEVNFELNGTNSDNQIVESTATDHRYAEFGSESITIKNNAVPSYVDLLASATYQTDSWDYELTWDDLIQLSGNTTICAYKKGTSHKDPTFRTATVGRQNSIVLKSNIQYTVEVYSTYPEVQNIDFNLYALNKSCLVHVMDKNTAWPSFNNVYLYNSNGTTEHGPSWATPSGQAGADNDGYTTWFSIELVTMMNEHPEWNPVQPAEIHTKTSEEIDNPTLYFYSGTDIDIINSNFMDMGFTVSNGTSVTNDEYIDKYFAYNSLKSLITDAVDPLYNTKAYALPVSGLANMWQIWSSSLEETVCVIEWSLYSIPMNEEKTIKIVLDITKR